MNVIDIRRAVLAAAVLTPLTAAAAQQAAQPAGQPDAPKPSAAAVAVPGTVTCPAPAPPAALPTRSFTAPAGMLMIPVNPAKVGDFDKFLGYVRDALAKTTDAGLREQARGWRFFKLAETGPNGDVLYALLADPAVPCVDYGFLPILNAAISDAKQLEEVWNLYRNSVRNGGHLMNFVPLTQSSGAEAAPPAPQKPR
jgi:hypothetical protein